VSKGTKLRVLSIAHSAVSRAVGRLRYHPLAARNDLDVHLVVPARWHQFGRDSCADPPGDPGVTVHILPIWFPHAGPMSWYLHVYPGLGKLIREIKPDVIHLWEEPWSIVALQAALLKGQASLVMEVDQNILKRLPPPFEAIRRHVLKQTSFVLSRSPDATAVVRARGYGGPVGPIGYGVDQQTFRPGTEVSRSQIGALRIGYVGRVIEEKGLDDAVEAIARAQSHVSLAIMGEGPHEGALRQRARTLGIEDRLSMEPWGSPSEVANFMRGLDILVLLTRRSKNVLEQFGRVIVEAQSCGIPVIGSSSGAIPSVVGDGGWIVSERDPTSLARLLDNLAASPQQVRMQAQLAQQNVATRFTYEIIASQLAHAWIEAAQSQKSTMLRGERRPSQGGNARSIVADADRDDMKQNRRSRARLEEMNMPSIRQMILSRLTANQKDTLRTGLAKLSLYQTPSEQIYLERIVCGSPSTFLVQIGANDGDDFVRSVTRRYGDQYNISGTIVEPQPHFYQKLIKNYERIDRIKIRNVAISDHAREATLYYIDYDAKGLPDWVKGLGSFNRDVVLSHQDLVPDIGRSVKTLKVRCITVKELISDAPDRTIDVLVVDTEGHDYVILRQFDFTQVRPKLIIFESKHLTADDFRQCDAMFFEAGYYVVHSGTDNSVALRSDFTSLLIPKHVATAIPPKVAGRAN
jgi:FkbM family methyltransferase